MRLNFSYSSDDEIREGIKRLGEVIQEELTTAYQQESYIPGGV
jgi:DNA-binding transcriptional MocR family regulator